MLPFAAVLACSPAPDRPGWVAAPVPDLVLARHLVPTGFTGPAEAECVADGDPLERHLVSTEHTERGPIELYGLLADTDYTCVITTSSTEDTLTFRTGSPPADLPHWTVTGAGGWGDYTIFNHGTDEQGNRNPAILIVDREGRLRWYFDVPFDAADLDVSYLGDGTILYGGGYGAPPSIVDLEGDTQLRVTAQAVYHHHAERLPSGEFLVLVLADNTDGIQTWQGMEVRILDPSMTSTVWSWNTQRGVDEGWLNVPSQPGDPYHINSAQVTDDAVFVNFRQKSLIARLDRQTGDLVWLLGANGDFTLVDETGAPDDVANWFYGAHAPEHDGNRILLHDNGYTRPGGPWSRAAEFEIDEEAGTARLTWQYTEEGWYEPIWGDVDRLPDGHVLYTRAHCGTCRPEDLSTTQIVEVDPSDQSVVWRLVLADVHDAGYRAQRIEGCALFGNTRYCPAP